MKALALLNGLLRNMMMKMKNKLLLLGVGLVVISVGYYLWIAKTAATGDGAVKPPSEPLVFNEQDIAGVREGLTKPFMQEVRRSLDAYRAKDEKWIAAHSWAFDEKNKTDVLAKLTEKELSSRFTPIGVQAGLMGGIEITLIFIDEPKRAYVA